eukprot:scaffold2878_cov111-Isochrysis_galbana.AAC.2
MGDEERMHKRTTRHYEKGGRRHSSRFVNSMNWELDSLGRAGSKREAPVRSGACMRAEVR